MESGFQTIGSETSQSAHCCSVGLKFLISITCASPLPLLKIFVTIILLGTYEGAFVIGLTLEFIYHSTCDVLWEARATGEAISAAHHCL